ncbi:hypothetical protein ACIA8R_33275 [Nonomuraea sp. NPDC051191]|uniref:hypothetical protein n=1 Tax=Nonomuraea sp. NPDC051191 TaxID=3364372 RepID=UPI00378DB168
MSIVAFPDRPDPATAGVTVTAAVERFLDSPTAATNPARRLERRETAHRGDRSIPRTRLETLFTDPAHALREKVLWRLLYDTAARAEKILTLNVEDLDLLDPHLQGWALHQLRHSALQHLAQAGRTALNSGPCHLAGDGGACRRTR